MKFNYPEGATPLDADELQALIPPHIRSQDQLNAWEQQNILLAQEWALNKRGIISLDFIQALHKHMFNQTWKWAGQFRHSNKNIGIEWHSIPMEVKRLCDDVSYQLEFKSFSHDEIAIRFHHRLVFIHPFPNGNGRHARLMADLLIIQQGYPRFSWGMHQNLYTPNPVRKQYIKALQLADRGDYSKLMIFARS